MQMIFRLFISTAAFCGPAIVDAAACDTDDGVGSQMVWVSNCVGAGCFANGVDTDCAWCVYDMAKCSAVSGQASCQATLDARVAQKVPCSYASGQGDWQYRYLPDLVTLPTSEVDNDANGHGVAKDSKGNIYFTFVPKKVTAETQVLVKFNSDGTNAVLLGKPGPDGLSAGIPHGLRIEDDKYFYHANNAQKVMKTDLEGNIIWTADFSNWKTEKPHFWPILPTDAIVVPGSDVLLVADGYGSSFIHSLNKTTGEYLEGRSFGGAGKTTEPLRFNTPHGINVDARMPNTFVVSDRSNSRLVWFTADGHFVKTVPTVHPLPCNVDVHDDPDAGMVAVVPSLGHSYQHLWNGSVEIYDKNDKLLSNIEVAKTIGYLGHQHPHDAMFLPNGDIVVCCWGGPATPGMGAALGTISYWRRERKSGACNVDDEDTDYVGDDIKVDGKTSPLPANSVGDCCAVCQNIADCTHWSWNSGQKMCYPKIGKGVPTAKKGDRSGTIRRNPMTIVV